MAQRFTQLLHNRTRVKGLRSYSPVWRQGNSESELMTGVCCEFEILRVFVRSALSLRGGSQFIAIEHVAKFASGDAELIGNLPEWPFPTKKFINLCQFATASRTQ